MKNTGFRKAKLEELDKIWQIILFAKESRRLDGSRQWQNGYPKPETIRDDIAKGHGYVITENGEIVFYAAIIFDVEPAYEIIEGKWLSDGPYCVIHRMAVSNKGKGKGLACKMLLHAEKLCRKRNIFSIKIDTNFDNAAMLRIIEKLGYSYCGEVYFRGEARQAFEKVLS